MEDFNALASSLAVGVGDVRGCLILSRDGLVLGAHPAETEIRATPAWVRFAALGDPERGFVQFGTESWCYVRRGPYAGFAVVGPGARPGLVIDHMDQVLLAAEEARSRHEGLRGVEAPHVAPVSKPRSHLHPEHPAPEPVVLDAAPVAAESWLSELADEIPPSSPPDVRAGDGTASGVAEPGGPPWPDAPVGHSAEAPFDHAANEPTVQPEVRPGADPSAQPRDERADVPGDEPGGQEDDVDRFSLAREFGQLLQHDEDAADG